MYREIIAYTNALKLPTQSAVLMPVRSKWNNSYNLLLSPLRGYLSVTSVFENVSLNNKFVIR